MQGLSREVQVATIIDAAFAITTATMVWFFRDSEIALLEVQRCNSLALGRQPHQQARPG